MSAPIYKRGADTAKRLLSPLKYGKEFQFRSKSNPASPVTGEGGGKGELRAANAVINRVKDGYFNEALRKAGDRMLVVSPEANLQVGEFWVDASGAEWPIIDLVTIKPDGETLIAFRALVRG